ncbi:MAG TPA: hypothetical protein VKU41_17165 [Polyangiaceae bacterium]|nr:hypothetical protein [Polyangiaceae bacterium]
MASALLVAGRAAAQEGEQTDLPNAVRAHQYDRDRGTNPFRGSVAFLEQSVTTQTASVGLTPLSYVPLYEVWLSLRPRYWFDEHWSVRARFDYTKELTNNQPTTFRDEDVFGDLWTELVYATKLDALWKRTKGDLGVRALWPLSKVSQAQGTYVTLGVRGGIAHEFPIRGDDAPSFESAHVGLRFVYQHAFANATTPNDYGNFAYLRENTDAQLFVSDQIQGQTLVEHDLWGMIEGGMQLTPRFAFNAFLVLMNQWHYQPTAATVQTQMGQVSVARPNDEQFTQNLWFVASLDYQLFNELEIGVGYYNLANAIDPDGQRRSILGYDNVWWSPDARIFVSLTANLDTIYDDALGHRFSSQAKQTAQSPRSTTR